MTEQGSAPSGKRRIMLVDDSALFREGLSVLLTAAGLVVVAELGHAVGIDRAIDKHRPDAVVLDARMPPSHTDEGIQAALDIRRRFPHVGVLVLSTYAEGVWANQLFSAGSAGLGYLLKDRVDDISALIDAIDQVASGGTVVDPDVVDRLLLISRHRSVLDQLSDREQEVLALMAQGSSNNGIGTSLHLSPRTVEAYIASIFQKLPIRTEDAASNRRVLAVLTFLQERQRR